MIPSQQEPHYPDHLILPTASLVNDFRNNTQGMVFSDEFVVQLLHEIMIPIMVYGDQIDGVEHSFRMLPRLDRVKIPQFDRTPQGLRYLRPTQEVDLADDSEYQSVSQAAADFTRLKEAVFRLGMGVYNLIEQMGCFSRPDRNGARRFVFLFQRLVGGDMLLRIPPLIGISTSAA
ncbi:hypothetical protein AWB81_01784 [Caballeronia arationis]|uniref:hypothetical protein n=1 Tax=Caballeronia arationis TaxID=1777142 RepID=UPI00074C6DE9|nr:hypothetical protein [Caballeronia arationis]SAK59045.1 hypothetical protein AWB81_01784 [Caballeronia arationis]